ncbi:MAG: hypothetical protein KQH53_04860 [Desulfarculaceae bacterium]|nr:hypothetical protein [Desulfarculaceae bacterium]
MVSSRPLKTFWPTAAFLLGLAWYLRLPWLLKADKFLDADHSVWGLMARHIAQGLAWPYYMYGQGYMGSSEAIFLAPLFAWFGASPTVMAWAMTGLSLVILLLAALLVRRLAGPRMALATLALAALAPPFFIRLGLLSYGGYHAVLLWGVLLWLLWSRVYLPLDDPQPGRWAWRLWLMGALCAVGWWTWTFFWLLVFPLLACHAAYLAGRLGRVRAGRPFWAPARGWDLAGAIALGLGLVYLAYALAVISAGREVSWPLLPGVSLQNDPHLALRQDLPIALGFMGLGLLLWLGPRLRRARRRPPGGARQLRRERLGRAGLVHLGGLLAFGSGLVLKQGGDVWYRHSDMAAWGSYVPPLLPAGSERLWANLKVVAGSMVPEAWSPHPPLAAAWLAWMLFGATLAAALAALGSRLVAARKRGLIAALGEDWLAFACAVSYLALLAALIFSTATVDRNNVRYFFESILWWPFLLAWGVRALYRRARWAGWVGGSALAGVLLASALVVCLHPAFWRTTSWREPYGPLLRYLQQEKVTRGWADYWVGNRLTFLTQEKLIFAMDRRYDTSLQRYHPYYYAVKDAARQAYLFRKGIDDAALERVRRDLKNKREPFTEKDLGAYRVILVENRS